MTMENEEEGKGIDGRRGESEGWKKREEGTKEEKKRRG